MGFLLSSVFNGLGELDDQCRGNKNHGSTDGQDNLPQRCVHQCVVPILIQKVHDGIFPMTRITMTMNSFLGSNTMFSSSPLTTRISLSLLTMGVRVVLRLRSCWQEIRASHHSAKHGVVNSVFQVMERRRHIGVDQHDAGHKTLENRQHRRIQVWNIFLHRRQDVLISEVGCGNDGKGRFQLRRNVLLKWLAVRASPTRKAGTYSLPPSWEQGSSMIAMDAPTAKHNRDRAQSMGKRAVLPVTLRTVTSAISGADRTAFSYG